MHDDKWRDIIEKVKESFAVEEHKTEELDDRPGTREYIVFTGPLGRMMLERDSSPKVLGKKGVGSNRIGSDTAVQYQYSDTETVHTFTAYTWKDGEWVAMEADAFDL